MVTLNGRRYRRWHIHLARRLARPAERLLRQRPWLQASWLGYPLRSLVRRQMRAAGLCDPYTGVCCDDVTLARLVDVPGYAAHHRLVDVQAVAAHYAVHRPAATTDGMVRFDAQAYLATNPDVGQARRDPLRHFLSHGLREGRWAGEGPPPADQGPIPDPRTMVAAARRHGAIDNSLAQVSVIVPVHDARGHTLRCLASLLAARTCVPHRVLVVDDASTDTALVADLQTLAGAGLIELQALQVNHGFAGAVNTGLAALAPSEDVVLLNSDTEVFDHWLDRLHATAHSATDVGTVTPLTNSGTILSYPVTLRDNPQALERPWREVDALATALAMPAVEIPTAVGFCMYIRRDCLDVTGRFDAAAFPQGYGEENDFCLRASALGWRHLAACDTFVFHAGSASFGAAKADLVQAGLAVLDRRYPEYQREVAAFIARDPLLRVRMALDCARITSLCADRTVAHWTRSPPAGWRNSDVRLTIDAIDGAVSLSCAGAPLTPSLTDMLLTDFILPYDEPKAAYALSLLAPAVLDLRDGENVGAGHLAKVNEIARKQAKASV